MRNVVDSRGFCCSKKREKEGTMRQTIEEGKDIKREFDVPTRTAPTNGWSRTHRTAMLAMLTPP